MCSYLGNVLRGLCINAGHLHIALAGASLRQHSTVAKHHLHTSTAAGVSQANAYFDLLIYEYEGINLLIRRAVHKATDLHVVLPQVCQKWSV